MTAEAALDALQQHVDAIEGGYEYLLAYAAQGLATDAGNANSEQLRTYLRRLDEVRTNYLGFIERHTNHARAHLAYASFLGDVGDEPESLPWLEKARDLDPRNPASWNNLANYYGHYGELTNAFACYARAIELKPDDIVYVPESFL